jgi:hypothetical protein
MPEPVSLAQAQAALLAMADRLKKERALLRRLGRGLVAPPDLEERQEDLKPSDVATELIGGIEHLLYEGIPEVIATLRRLGRVTDQQLEAEFKQRQRRRRFAEAKLPDLWLPTPIAQARGEHGDDAQR